VHARRTTLSERFSNCRLVVARHSSNSHGLHTNRRQRRAGNPRLEAHPCSTAQVDPHEVCLMSEPGRDRCQHLFASPQEAAPESVVCVQHIRSSNTGATAFAAHRAGRQRIHNTCRTIAQYLFNGPAISRCRKPRSDGVVLGSTRQHSDCGNAASSDGGQHCTMQ
jgi:hypothetical protein